jgi:riboflavin kinase / FMN adenylyltransferase
MKTFVGIDALQSPAEGSAVTIGTFDGVHLGHRALISRTIEAAGGRLASTAITWDRHPFVTLRPDHVPPLLTSQERKLELIHGTGVDVCAVLVFDKELSTWSPERFVDTVLVAGLGARVVVVGEGWRFGHRAAGDVELLRRLGAEQGFEVHTLELAEVGGDVVSSTRVREAVISGDMELSEVLLGRRFDIGGVVIKGESRGGSLLGYPTANLDVDPALAHPRRGVYAGRAAVGNDWYPAAINVGVNPTFGGDERNTPLRIEAYLLDFEGDLYGVELRIEFWRRLRDEVRFDSVDELIAQIGADVEATRALTC